MKRFNLLPPDRRPKLQLDVDKVISFAAVILVVFGVVYVGQGLLKMHKFRKELKVVQRELSQTNTVKKRLESKMEVQRNKVKVVEDKLVQKRIWTQPLQELSLMSPKEVWMRSLDLQHAGENKNIILEGSSPGLNHVMRFYGYLKKSKTFSNVEFAFARLRLNTVPELFDFQLKVQKKMVVKINAKKPK